MKTTDCRFGGVTTIAALLLAVSMIGVTGCGGEKDDPDVVTRNDLKSPGALKIADLGNGDIRLTWFTSNYEDDFEGYNIYGAKGTPEELGVTEGEPIQLLDAEGDPIDSTKTILSTFSYNSNNPSSLPGAAQVTDGALAEDTELKFSALPYHRLRTANSEPNLPTCKPNISGQEGECVFLGSSKEETDASAITSIGTTSLDFPETLTVGQSYCFFVFSVQNEGEEISQSSSNVACVTPKFKLNGSATVGTAGNNALQRLQSDEESNQLDAIRDACSQGDCPELAFAAENTQISPSSPQNITFQFEKYSTSDDAVYIVTGNNAAIRSLGYFSDGFADPEFLDQISQAPAFSLSGDSSVKNPGGYSLEGQSILLKANQIYVLASGDQSEATPTSFYYDWLYFSQTCEAAGSTCTVDFQLLLSGKRDSQTR